MNGNNALNRRVMPRRLINLEAQVEALRQAVQALVIDHAALPAETKAEAALAARHARLRFLPQELFREPAWDMLLDLYVAMEHGKRVSTSSLCIAAGVPTTTSLRHIEKLARMGMVKREGDPDDRRRVFVSLTDQAITAIAGYFAYLEHLTAV